MRWRTTVGVGVAWLGLSILATSLNAQAASPVGVWTGERYELADGAQHPIRGQIFFTENSWQVLFFVMDGDEVRRGSAEGGRYTLEGEQLVFEHLYHFSTGEEMQGLPASPLRLTAREGDGPLEPTGLEVAGDILTLHFPSGNRMRFRRGS